MASPRPLAALLPTIAGPGFGNRKALLLGTLLAEWPSLVGGEYAAVTMPAKVSFAPGSQTRGTLHLKVDSAHVLKIQYSLTQLRERLNGFLGAAVIGQIRILQDDLSGRLKPPPPPVSPARKQAIRQAVAAVPDPELRAALARFGEALATSDGHPAPSGGRPAPSGGRPAPSGGRPAPSGGRPAKETSGL